jgi:hypothetical protein
VGLFFAFGFSMIWQAKGESFARCEVCGAARNSIVAPRVPGSRAMTPTTIITAMLVAPSYGAPLISRRLGCQLMFPDKSWSRLPRLLPRL